MTAHIEMEGGTNAVSSAYAFRINKKLKLNFIYVYIRSN